MKKEQRPFLPHLLIICITGVLVYYPILRNQLLDYWDDQWVVMNYYTEGGFTADNLWLILTDFYHGQYAPFNEYLYLTLYTFFGYNPFPYHLAGMLLHIANACLLYCMLWQLMLQSGRSDKAYLKIIPFITAFIFVLHPFNVESVAWASASKVLVYTFFYLLATYSFLLFLKTKKYYYYVFTIILFVFSFLGKEQAVTFPAWMLLIYWFLNYNLKSKTVWITTAPFWAMALAFGIITMLSQKAASSGILTAEPFYPLWERMVYACYSLIECFIKCVVPFKLSYLYPFPSLIGEPLPFWLLLYPAILIIICFTLWEYISKKMIAFGLVFFLIHIAVALHIIPLSRFTVVADRYAYLASAGVCFIIAYGFVHLYRKLIGQWRMGLLTALSLLILYMGVYANTRTRVWYNVDTLKKEIRGLLKEHNAIESSKAAANKN